MSSAQDSEEENLSVDDSDQDAYEEECVGNPKFIAIRMGSATRKFYFSESMFNMLKMAVYSSTCFSERDWLETNELLSRLKSGKAKASENDKVVDEIIGG